jgi:glutathione synthase
MTVLFVTDPLEGLDPAIDASIGLMVAAAAAGTEVWVCTPEQLEIVAGRVLARGSRLRLSPGRRGRDHRWLVEAPWCEVIEQRELDVARDTGLVLLRIDPPVDARYLHTTYVLDLVESLGGRVSNRPSGVRALHEKLVALQHPELCPETLVTTRTEAVLELVARVGAVVVKPVDGFAGADVWLVRHDSVARSLVESATHGGRRHVIAQRYLGAVEDGNKRLFVLGGEIVGTVLRRPAPDDFRIGPPVAAAEPDERDRRIVAALAPTLMSHGIDLAGIDVIDGCLIEVNVTCPGGMHKTDALLGTDLSGAVLRRLLNERNVA